MLVPTSERKLREQYATVIVGFLDTESIKKFTHHHPGNELDKVKYLQIVVAVHEDSLQQTLRQLMAIGLIGPQLVLRQGGDQYRTITTSDRCWALTPLGNKKFLEKRAFRK